MLLIITSTGNELLNNNNNNNNTNANVPPMSRYIGVVEGPKTLSGCRFARQGQTKSGSRSLGIRP